MKPLLTVFALTLGLAYGADAEHHDSLYHRLGGEKAMHAVVDEFVGRLTADQHLHQWFEHVAKDAHEATEFKAELASFLCQATGGGCAYHGKTMAEAHHGMHVTDEAFGLVAKHLEETLDHLKVHETEKHEVMALAAGLHGAIVK